MSKATILLNTGTMSEPIGVVGENVIKTDTSTSERIVYPRPVEQYVAVPPGHMVVLTSYTKTCKPICVSKVLLSNGVPDTATGSGCCSVLTKGASSTVLNRVVIPAYTMTMDNPVTVLNIPGIYSISPTDDSEGDIVVTATEYPLQQNGPIINDATCYCGE